LTILNFLQLIISRRTIHCRPPTIRLSMVRMPEPRFDTFFLQLNISRRTVHCHSGTVRSSMVRTSEPQFDNFFLQLNISRRTVRLPNVRTFELPALSFPTFEKNHPGPSITGIPCAVWRVRETTYMPSVRMFAECYPCGTRQSIWLLSVIGSTWQM